MWDFLKGPIVGLVGSVGEVIDNLHTSGEEKAAARLALLKLQSDLQIAVMENEREWVKAQSEVIRAEVTSGGKLARNWRPILMLTFTYIIAHNYVIAPIFTLPFVVIPPDMWDLLRIGVGGYIIGRTGEKMMESYSGPRTEKDG